MKVLDLKAEPSPDGRIVLSWQTPPEPSFRGTRVLRRRRRFPDAGDLDSDFEVYQDAVTRPGEPAQFIDGPLQGEVVYYYSVVSYDAAGRKFSESVSAMAAAPYQTAGHLHRSLPEIYQIFDRAAAAPLGGLAPADREKGPLQRLLDMFGQPFDLLRSFASAMRSFHDVERVDGALLPLLATWIGLPSDTTLDLERQRNEIRYAPHYARTAGIPANLRAAVNRFSTWDARIKEFVHNVFLATHPEQLTIWSMQREGTTWQAAGNVNLEVAYEGRAAPLRASDGRPWIFYHAVRTEGHPPDEWHIYGKIEERGEGLPAFRLTFGSDIHKHPSAVQRPDGSVWLFYTRYGTSGQAPVIELQVMSAGRPALPARLAGTQREPFPLADGDMLNIAIQSSAGTLSRLVTVRAENFDGEMGAASAADVARLLALELPGALARATPDGRVQIRTAESGPAASLTVAASSMATKLGFGIALPASEAAAALLTGTRNAPFHLTDGAQLTICFDGETPRTVTFASADFADIANATAPETVAAINRQSAGAAEVAGAAVRLRSSKPGGLSLVSVQVNASPAAAALGFGAPPPAAPGVEEDEPSACVDSAGDVWLFFASRRSGIWKIWYSRSDGLSWAAPKQLTAGALPDREPFVLLDAAAARLWVFWSRQKGNGLWNVFSRTTTSLNFATLVDGDWPERENGPVPTTFNNREPSAITAAAGDVELYFASDRADGWNVWTRSVTVAGEAAELPLTHGQETRRAPAPLRLDPSRPGNPVRMYFRSNESQLYTSSVYPLARTLDGRYSGSTAIDLRNATKLSLSGEFADMQRYTSDTRRPAPGQPKLKQKERMAGVFARDCVGVFLTADTEDQTLIFRQSQLFADALRRFVPIQVRLAFLIDQVFVETVYTYSQPAIAPPVLIGERMIDTILPEVVRGFADSYVDTAPLVHFLHLFAPGTPLSVLPDLSVASPDLNSRLFTINFGEGA